MPSAARQVRSAARISGGSCVGVQLHSQHTKERGEREALGEGPRDSEDVKRAALAAGHGERLGVRSVRAGFGPGSTIRWELPSEQP